jgi:predicted ATP-dependent endonuclease of OLD family
LKSTAKSTYKNLEKMRIVRIKIKNFRGVKEGLVYLDTHTVLIGANNVGKTCIIEALALLLGRDKLIRNLTEHDFFGATPTPTDRIMVTALITDFSENNPDLNYDWFRKGRAIPKWLNINDKSVHSEQLDPSWKLCAEIGVCGRFDFEDLTVETIRYFVDVDDNYDPFDDEEYIEKIPTSLIKESGFFLVPASRTWDKMLSFTSELFRRVVSSIGTVPAQAILNQRDQVRFPEIKIDEENEIKEIFDAVNAEIAYIFPSAPKGVLRLTGTNSESILSSLIPHFINGNDSIPIPANRQGNGIVSMQNLLLLLQLGQLRRERNQDFIVAIEEPELHIPPSQQRRLTNRLKACCQQTIVTTHSPEIASEFEPQSIRILTNQNGKLEAKPIISEKLSQEETNPVRHLIQWQKRDAIHALMHERLLIPEGKGDFNWLRLLTTGLEIAYESPNQYSNIFSCLIGVFPTDSAAVEKVFKLLANAHSNVFCLIDGDAEGLRYIENLKKLEIKPRRILRWLNNFTIEDVIGQLLKTDESYFLPKLTDLIGDKCILSIEDFIGLLKLPHRNNNGGRKDDYLLHEEIVKLIFSSKIGTCSVSQLIEGIIDVTNVEPKQTGFIKNELLSDDKIEVFDYKI